MKKSDNIEEFSGPRWKEKTFADSSLIEKIKYDYLMQTLFVKFKNKESKYSFFDVPVEVANNLFESKSVGKYFHEFIKGKYNHHKQG
jgi:lysyl-tRNA synthetase class 2